MDARVPKCRLAHGARGNTFGQVPANRHDTGDRAGQDRPEKAPSKNAAADAPPQMLALLFARPGVADDPLQRLNSLCVTLLDLLDAGTVDRKSTRLNSSH